MLRLLYFFLKVIYTLFYTEIIDCIANYDFNFL